MITVAPHVRFLRLILAMGLLGASVAARAGTLAPWTGGPTPELRGKTLSGQELRLADFRGHTVVVNFWATWCAPCVAEMPALQRLHDKLGARQVAVIAVNFQENAARIRPFVERLGLTFPVIRDHDGTLRAAWKVGVFPSSFVIGPDQRIAFVATGEIDWDDPQVESRIRGIR